MAERWAAKAHPLMHAREVLRMQILEVLPLPAAEQLTGPGLIVLEHFLLVNLLHLKQFVNGNAEKPRWMKICKD